MNIKKKIVLSILLIVILSVIGVIVYFLRLQYISDESRTKRYMLEIKDLVKIDDNKEVINALKLDLNLDNVEDYILLIGQKEVANQNIKSTQNINYIESYSNVSLEYVDGKSHEISICDTTTFINTDLKFGTNIHDSKSYIYAFDNISGNIVLCSLQDNKLVDIIKNSSITEFNGYTFTLNWDSDVPSKLKISLDNYKRDYLPKQDNEFVLDFANTQVDKKNYRESYLANKFCTFEVADIDEDNIVELIGIQNILYLNKNMETDVKTAGTIKTIFKIEDSKIIYKDIKVEI